MSGHGRRLTTVAVLVTVAGLTAGWMAGLLLSGIDRAVYDAILSSILPARGRDPVVYVLVRNWPCGRSDLGRAVTRIREAGARAIGLDVGLDEVIPGDPYRNEDESRALSAALEACPVAVIAVEKDASGGFVMPHGVFRERRDPAIGNAHFKLDLDGIVRRTALRDVAGDRVIWALGFKLAQAYLGVLPAELPGDPLPARFDLGGRTVRTVDRTLLIRYSGRPGPRFEAGGAGLVSAEGVVWLEDWLALSPEVDRSLFEDRVALVGAIAGTSGDTFRTPLSGERASVPGVAIHGEIVRTLIRGDAPWLPHPAIVLTLLAFVVYLVVVLGIWGPPWPGPLLAGVLLGGYSAAVPALAAAKGAILPVANPIVALLVGAAGAYLTRRIVRPRLDSALEFLQGHLKDGGAIGDVIRLQQEIEQHLQSYEVERTVMFTDIKGSTSYFAAYGDQEGRKMVERHNGLLMPLVERHAGHVIKTIGDAIMASFPAPDRAVDCAVEMQRILQAHNAGVERPEKEIHIRIGMNHGTGIQDPKDVFGTLVNVAARVEALADGDQIYLTDTVFRQLTEAWQRRCANLGPKAIRGTGKELVVYEVLWRREEEDVK